MYADYEEVVRLTDAFNQMLGRIEEERRESVRAALGAQESERRRVAQELHDEIGQSLTAIALRLEAALRRPGAVPRQDLRDVQSIAESSVDEVREIARRLRPEMLDDLGLTSALVALTEQVTESAGIEIRRSLERELPDLGDEVDLVVYRVAQECLTNIIRHSNADVATVVLSTAGGGLALSVEDNGQGMNGAKPGTGIQGMRERAVLIGASLTVEDAAPRGVRVCLQVPATGAGGDVV
jgi:two-component system sensor histidine kinase UhpB